MERQFHDADVASLMWLLDKSQVMVLIFEPTGAIRHASPALERALNWSQGDLEDFADNVELASDGIWVIDADGQTHYANPRMDDILAHDGVSIAGRPLADFADDPVQVLALKADAISPSLLWRT